MKVYPLLLIIIIFSTSCQNRKKDKLKESVYKINFEDCIKNTKQFNISEIADTIKYIKLETPSGVIITQIRKVLYSEPYIFLTSKGTAYQFTTEGKYIRTIGRKGKGPGEYLAVENIFIDAAKNEVILCTILKFLYYNFNGEFLKEEKILAQSTALQDSIIWISNPTRGHEKFKLIGLNDNMDTVARFINFEIWQSKFNGYYSVTSKFLDPFYHYNNKLYFKGFQDSDSIWEINGKLRKLYSVIEMGKFKLPLNYQADFSPDNFNRYCSDFYSIPYINEDNRYFFISAQPWCKSKLPIQNILFDKDQNKGFIVKNNQNSGLYDDILNGPSLWPLTVTDDYYICVIEPDEIFNNIDEGKIHSESLKTLLSQLDENSNQVIVLLKKKQLKDMKMNN